jgi:hypothetical protein
MFHIDETVYFVGNLIMSGRDGVNLKFYSIAYLRLKPV